jgi:hypothetical protein
LANFRAVFEVGNALEKFLQARYPDDLNESFPCAFKLVSSADIATEDTTPLDKTVSILLHRITSNEHERSITQLQDSRDKQPVLALDLHYMITYWGTSAEAEQVILTWTMQQLQSLPILDRSVLSASAAWDATETVQIIPADLSLEDILRIWDALGPKYRLSVSYVARIVRIDRTAAPGPPVVTTRFTFEPVEDAP